MTNKETSKKLDDPTRPDPGTIDVSVEAAFGLVERLLLIVVALMTIGAALITLHDMFVAQTISLADILLMFLYTEVIGMIAVFYTRRGSALAYPIFIAITALARLIVLQGKDMAPENIVFESGAILLLAIAAVIIVRGRAPADAEQPIRSKPSSRSD
ncbi:MAG: phosphate-starvation-inducible PsiE family protein [Xanthobacteraceae bacterium]